MHQLSEKIRSQEQAELESEGKEAVEHESAQLAQSTVAKHWGGKQRKSRARIAALIGDEADAAAEQYQHRHVQGLKLLVVGSSEMVGELSLGIKQPEQDEVEDPADAARKLVDSVRQRRLGHQSSSKRKSDHADRSNFNNMKKVLPFTSKPGDEGHVAYNHGHLFRWTMWTQTRRSSQLCTLLAWSPKKHAHC